MARAVLGPILNDLRGKVGSSVFDNYQGVHIVRSMPSVITNPQSEYQTYARDALSAFVSAWKGLTLAQKQAWEYIAGKMIKGQESQGKRDRGCLIPVSRGPYSAYNAFVSCNMNRHSSGFSDLDEVLIEPPDGIILPEPLKSFSATVSGRTITASWEYITPGPRFERLEIWIKSPSAKVHRQLLYTEDRNANGSTDIEIARGRLGVWITLPNGVYSLQARIINKYGLPTAPSELAFVQIGGADVYTYLAARQSVLSQAGVGVSIPDTQIDLSGSIPAGAHTAILTVELILATVGGAGLKYLELYKTVAQGDAIKILQSNVETDHKGRQFHVPLSTDRKIRYAYTHAGAGGTSNIDVWLLGYIS